MNVSNQDYIFHEAARVRDTQLGLNAGKSQQFKIDQIYFKRKITS